ncbi:unnamed protein product, partial [marine sediment metagenome]
DEALIIAKKQYNDNFDGHSDKIIHNLTPIYQSHDTPIKIAMYVHRGRDACMDRSLSLIKMAKNSIYLVLTDYDFLDTFYENVKKARARGVIDIKLLVEDNALEDKKKRSLLEKYLDICEIKSRDQVFGNSV